MIVFPNCKINIGLHILGKRNDGFHDLETLFYPLPLTDALEIIQNMAPGAKGVDFKTSGITIDGEEKDNICIRAYNLLKINFPRLPAVKMHLHKVIPIGGGLGGGSADGAFTLMLLNEKFNLELDEKQLIAHALHLGSDCPFFIVNKPALATGRGEDLQVVDLDLSAYKIILINPGVHIHTAWAFGHIKPGSDRNGFQEILQLPLAEWKEHLHNDFEEPVFSHFPEIKKIKEDLYAAGAIYASMSGSGSTVYALFKKDGKIPHFPSHYYIKIVE